MVNLKKEEDDQLIKHYLNGTEAAFGSLVNRYKKEIYQRIYFIVRDKISAEDILQDTLVKIVRSIKSELYNEEGKFLPWALIIARNLCLDYKRKTKHSKHVYRTISTSQGLYTERTVTPCPLNEKQLRQQMESILSQLPHVQSTVIRYRHFEEMSFKQISIMMNTSVSTTIGRMRYGLRSLNRLIGNNRSVFQ